MTAPSTETIARDRLGSRPRLFGRAFASVIFRANTFYLRIRNVLDRPYVRRYEPKLIDSYRYIAEQTGKPSPQYPFQGADILRKLETYRPAQVVEHGSGRSTVFFAAYAARNGTRFVSVEQVESWRELANEATRRVTGSAPVVHSDIRTTAGLGGRYIRDIDMETDFIYVDGPTVKMKTDLPAGKGVNTDVYDFLDRGGLPKIIMIEGRTDTIDHLLSHPAVAEYRFHPEFIYAFRKRLWREALKFRRHTLFVRKSMTGGDSGNRDGVC